MTSSASHRSTPALYIILALVLLACLWAGWRDFDPWVPRDEVRENIRSTIRGVIQILIQFVVPGAIIVFFGKETVAKIRGSRASSEEV